jgi:hypothetical protein
MIKDEILKLVIEIKEVPGVQEVITLQYDDGRWVPMIMVIEKDGNFTTLKKRGLSPCQDAEAIVAMEKFIKGLGSSVEKLRYCNTQ